MTGTLSEDEKKKLVIRGNVIRCPFFTGKDCKNIKLTAVRNEYTSDSFLQVRSPFCVPEDEVSPNWSDYKKHLTNFIKQQTKKEINLNEEMKDD